MEIERRNSKGEVRKFTLPYYFVCNMNTGNTGDHETKYGQIEIGKITTVTSWSDHDGEMGTHWSFELERFESLNDPKLDMYFESKNASTSKRFSQVYSKAERQLGW